MQEGETVVTLRDLVQDQRHPPAQGRLAVGAGAEELRRRRPLDPSDVVETEHDDDRLAGPEHGDRGARPSRAVPHRPPGKFSRRLRSGENSISEAGTRAIVAWPTKP